MNGGGKRVKETYQSQKVQKFYGRYFRREYEELAYIVVDGKTEFGGKMVLTSTKCTIFPKKIPGLYVSSVKKGPVL